MCELRTNYVRIYTAMETPYHLTVSVERPRGGVYRHDIASEVSSVPR